MQLDPSAQPHAPTPKPFYAHLYFQVVTAIICGALVGHFFPQTGEALVRARNRSGARYPWGTEWNEETITHRVSEDRPEAASVVGEHRTTVELPDRTLVWEARTSLSGDRENFTYSYVRRLLRDGELVRERRWDDTIPRDHQ